MYCLLLPGTSTGLVVVVQPSALAVREVRTFLPLLACLIGWLSDCVLENHMYCTPCTQQQPDLSNPTPARQVTSAAVERSWRDGLGVLMPQGHNTQEQVDGLAGVEWVVDYAADGIEAARTLQRAILSEWFGLWSDWTGDGCMAGLDSS